MRLLVAAVAPLLLGGCVADLLSPSGVTVLAFACALLDAGQASRVDLAWSGEGPAPAASLEALASQLAAVSGRPSGQFSPSEHAVPETPRDGWSPEGVAAWARERPFLERDTLTLRILWLPSLGGHVTGATGPGTVAVAADAVEEIAARGGKPVSEVERILLLHHAGHALGLVNRGIPVQDPTLEEREGPAGHEPDPASVLAVGWEDVRTAAWIPNATYEGYSQDVRRDLAAAAASGGTCA